MLKAGPLTEHWDGLGCVTLHVCSGCLKNNSCLAPVW